MSSEPHDRVDGILLGPNCVKVLVESATKPGTHLWRPVGDMKYIDDAVGGMIAWSTNYCIPLEMTPDDTTDIEPKVIIYINLSYERDNEFRIIWIHWFFCACIYFRVQTQLLPRCVD